MSYHRPLGLLDPSSTQLFAQAVDPYAFRAHPDAIYSPYGWGPDFTYGMPLNYTHHIDYVKAPIPGARRVGSMYDTLSGAHPYLLKMPPLKLPPKTGPGPIRASAARLRTSLRRNKAVMMVMDAYDEQGPYLVVVGDRRRAASLSVPNWFDGYRVAVTMTTPIVPLSTQRVMLSGVLAVL